MVQPGLVRAPLQEGREAGRWNGGPMGKLPHCPGPYRPAPSAPVREGLGAFRPPTWTVASLTLVYPLSPAF